MYRLCVCVCELYIRIYNVPVTGSLVRGGSRKQDRRVLNQWCALARAKFSASPLNLTLVEELLNHVARQQAS